MNETADRPAPMRRLAAIAALLLVAGVIIATVVIVLKDPLIVVAQVLLLAILATGAWVAVTRTAVMRWVAAIIAIAAVVGILALELSKEGRVGVSLIVRIVLLLVAAGLARYAAQPRRAHPTAERDPGRSGARRLTQRPHHEPQVRRREGGALPASQGMPGARHRADRPGVGRRPAAAAEDAEECRARGVEPTVQTWGDDLSQLAHDAIDRGVDVIGMAGGDGSQALVASIAAERGVPMVVIPAGTRNHFALDLGLDRDDVVGALDAYGPAVERTIDLGDVNGRVFVNNVSMGLYAVIVESSEYRDAKMETTLAALPQMLGPDTKPFDLRFTSGDGVQHDGAHVIQVSNNPYGGTLSTMATRPRLDTGKLGVFALVAPDALGVTRFLAQLALGHPERYEGFSSWSEPRVEITSGSPIAVGLDGESLTMDAPLVFTSRPGCAPHQAAAAGDRLLPGRHVPAPGGAVRRSVARHAWAARLDRRLTLAATRPCDPAPHRRSPRGRCGIDG